MTAGRFAENNELKYSIRALEKNAPWVRKIYIVTNGQVPSWLNTSHPKIRVVTHEEIFTNKSHLPTFSSPAIESHLFQIKGLAKRFIYINDDILITSPVKKEDFYTDEKGSLILSFLFRFNSFYSMCFKIRLIEIFNLILLLI